MYSMVLDAVPLICVEIALFAARGLYLARRRVEPAAGCLWIMGGRIEKWEHLDAAATRVLERESGLCIPSTKFIPVPGPPVRNFWPRRNQPPQENGVDCLSFLFAYELDFEQAVFAANHLSPEDCSLEEGLSVYSWEDIASGSFHTTVKDYAARVNSLLSHTR